MMDQAKNRYGHCALATGHTLVTASLASRLAISSVGERENSYPFEGKGERKRKERVK